MIPYNIVSAICFLLLTFAVLYVVLSIVFKTRADRVTFIRGFKRGKCIAIFLIAIPLLFIGYLYGQPTDCDSVFKCIFNTAAQVFDFVILKFNISKVENLINDNMFYKVTLYYCCVLVILNAAVFALSFMGKFFWQFKNKIVRRFTKKKKLVIFGNNDNSISVYGSAKDFCSRIVDNISAEGEFGLYQKDIRFSVIRDAAADIGGGKKRCGLFAPKTDENTVEYIVKSAFVRDYTVVINYEDDEKNLRLCNIFKAKAAEFIDAKIAENKGFNGEVAETYARLLGDAQAEAKKYNRELTEQGKNELRKDAYREVLFNHLCIYVFGDPRYEALYGDIVQSSFGCIRYKNKYQILAMDFIDKYPITRFMDERHIDYSTTFIKPQTEINVCMIGFGKPNRQVFLTSVANNQFLTETDGKPVLKRVNYHIFDKKRVEDKNLNHLYYRFKNEFQNVNADDYLPLPDIPANEPPHNVDINSPEFYNELRSVVTRSSNDVNIVIVSFGDDLENIDLAQKLIEKRKEWETENTVIFVRVQKEHNGGFVFREENVYCFGNERDIVYDIKRITNDKYFLMAQMRNEIYDLEYKITHDKDFVLDEASVLKNRIDANKNWFMKKSQLERESSLYCCLSLQTKLNLMGLDYIAKDGASGGRAYTEEEYIAEYAANDMPDFTKYGIELEGKKVINYTLDFPQSKRKNLAVLEHYRWNSFMLSKGVVPASKDKIINEKNASGRYTNGRNYLLRRHGNLTTFDGLIEFRKLIAKREKRDEAEFDVIKYDYQIMDDAYWLLEKNGFEIVKRTVVKKQ